MVFRSSNTASTRCVLLLLCSVCFEYGLGWISSVSSRSLPLYMVDRAAESNKEQMRDSDEPAPSSQRIRILGVGGGIGSGKSTACKILADKLGCIAHIDADSVAHSVYQPGSQCIQDIADEFGSDIVQENGEIDRPKLGSIVFADRSDMKKLEAIVWPYTKNAVLDQIESIKSECGGAMDAYKYPVIVVEAAMLLDAGWNEFLDGIWIVTTSSDLALKRLMETRNLPQEEAQKRIDAQLSRRGVANLAQEVEKGLVSTVIENRGGLQELQQALESKLNGPGAWYKR